METYLNLAIEEKPKPRKTELERAIEIGKMPYGSTSPKVFVCGACRTIEISEDSGVCIPCYAILSSDSAMGRKSLAERDEEAYQIAKGFAVAGIIGLAILGLKWLIFG